MFGLIADAKEDLSDFPNYNLVGRIKKFEKKWRGLGFDHGTVPAQRD